MANIFTSQGKKTKNSRGVQIHKQEKPFRPAIDDFVVRLIDGTSLNSPGVKQGLARAASQPFLPDGTRIPGALDDLAQQLGRYIEGDVDRLRVACWAGPVAGHQEFSYA